MRCHDPPGILIVDDEPFNVDLLEQELEDLGYRTSSARNGKEALEQVAADPPDLILLDVMMPVLDGLTVCRRLEGRRGDAADPGGHHDRARRPRGSHPRHRGGRRRLPDQAGEPARAHCPHPDGAQAQARDGSQAHRAARVKDHFAKFVPDSVKRLVAANPNAPELAKSERDVSVLFCDVSGYTRLSERLSPDALNAMVESYFSAFLDCNPRSRAATSTRRPATGSWRSSRRRSARPRPAGGRSRAGPARAHRGAQPRQSRLPARDPHGTQFRTGVGRLDALRGRARQPLDLHRERPGNESRRTVGGRGAAGQILAGMETVRHLGENYPTTLLRSERLKNMGSATEIYQIGRSR